MFKKLIIVLVALLVAKGIYAESDDVIWKIPMPRTIKDIQLTPDEKYLTVTDESATPKLLDANDGSLIREYVGLNGQTAHDVSSDGVFIASTGFVGELPNQLLSSIKVWDLNSGELIKTLLEDKQFNKTYNGIHKVKFSVDGRFLFATVTCKDGKSYKVFKWDTETWELINTSSCVGAKLLAMSPNGDVFATASMYNEPDFISLWDVETNRPISSLGSQTYIRDITFSSNGEKFASSGSRSLKVWNVEDKSLINEFYLEPRVSFNKFDISNDSKFIFVGFRGPDTVGIKVYDLINNQLVYTYKPQIQSSRSIEITNDSKYIFVAYGPYIFKLHARFETTSVKYESEFTSSNLPNPFTDHTSIQFYLNKPGDATVAISDNNGNEIDMLLNSYLDVGKHNIDWDSSKFPSGIYYCNIIYGAYRETIKLTLQR